MRSVNARVCGIHANLACNSSWQRNWLKLGICKSGRKIKIRNIPSVSANRDDIPDSVVGWDLLPSNPLISPVEYSVIFKAGPEKFNWFHYAMATVMMKQGDQVPDEFIDSFRENFNLVDEDKDGFISREQASLLYRGLGQTPTNSELNELIAQLPQQISFDDFVNWFSTSYKDPIRDTAITKAFRVFDLSNSGVLPVSKFRELLSNLGDHMSPEEIEEILKEIPVDSRGNFDYVVFARKLAEGPKGCPTLISREN